MTLIPDTQFRPGPLEGRVYSSPFSYKAGLVRLCEVCSTRGGIKSRVTDLGTTPPVVKATERDGTCYNTTLHYGAMYTTI